LVVSLFRFIFALVTLQQTFHITKHVTNITILFQGVDNKMENLDFVTKKKSCLSLLLHIEFLMFDVNMGQADIKLQLLGRVSRMEV
jgi:hypothetical protein